MKSSASWPSFTQVTWFARPLRFSALIVISASVLLSSAIRISTGFRSPIDCLLGKAEMELGTFIELALGPHPAAMACHDPLDDGESHSGAGKLLGAVQALEHPEQFIVV